MSFPMRSMALKVEKMSENSMLTVLPVFLEVEYQHGRSRVWNFTVTYSLEGLYEWLTTVPNVFATFKTRLICSTFSRCDMVMVREAPALTAIRRLALMGLGAVQDHETETPPVDVFACLKDS